MNPVHRFFASRIAITFVCVTNLTFLSSLAIAQSSHVIDRALVGVYDGTQTEMAVNLELRADGRFQYALSYGALDEEAEGRWTKVANTVLLTSDPVTPPRFVLVEEKGAFDGRLRLKLDLPEGMSGQFFHAETRFADGTSVDRQLSEQGDLPPIKPPAPATHVTLLLPIVGLSSGEVQLSGTGGHQLRFRFEPNDLGKVAFAQTVLRIDGGDLVLQRHDRTIRFRRLPISKPPS